MSSSKLLRISPTCVLRELERDRFEIKRSLSAVTAVRISMKSHHDFLCALQKLPNFFDYATAVLVIGEIKGISEKSATELISSLVQTGVFEDTSKRGDVDKNVWSRQDTYFKWSDAVDVNPRDVSRRIGIIGLGAFGHCLLQLIDRQGLGTVVACDYDIVEESNIARQSFYRRCDIGLDKVLATNLALDRGELIHSGHEFTNGRMLRIREIEDKFGDVEFMFNYHFYNTGSELGSQIYDFCAKKNIPSIALGGVVGPIFVDYELGFEEAKQNLIRMGTPFYCSVSSEWPSVLSRQMLICAHAVWQISKFWGKHSSDDLLECPIIIQI